MCALSEQARFPSIRPPKQHFRRPRSLGGGRTLRGAVRRWGVGYQHSNADTVSDLGNAFGEFGGTATLGLGGYANVFGGAGRCQGKIVNGFNAGATAGVGASVSANGTYTFAFQLTGPPDPPCHARQLK